LFLAGVPLFQKTATGFAPRRIEELDASGDVFKGS
jgi:hypothetical protein